MTPDPLTPGVTHCPAHPDRSPSLSVTRASDGRWLLHCHAGCPTEAILRAWGLAWSDLFPEDGSTPVSRPWRPVGPDRVVADAVYAFERRQAKGEASGMRDAWAGLDAIRGQLASAQALRGLVQDTVSGREHDARGFALLEEPIIALEPDERAWALLEAAARMETEAEGWGAAWDDAMLWPPTAP